LYWLPFALALLLFAFQLWHLSGFENITRKFEVQTGFMSSHTHAAPLRYLFWKQHMVRGYGMPGVVLVLASAAGLVLVAVWLALRKWLKRPNNEAAAEILELCCLLLAPCLLTTLFLKNHCAHPFHYFTTLKYSVPLAAIPFVLGPVLVLALFKVDVSLFSPRRMLGCFVPRWRGIDETVSLLPLASVALAVCYIFAERPAARAEYVSIFPGAPKVLQDTFILRMREAQFIGMNTNFHDIVFTPDKDLEQSISPFWLGFSMKRVYLAGDLQTLYEKVAGIGQPFAINILGKQTGTALRDAGLDALRGKATTTVYSPGLMIERVSKQDFLDACRQFNVKMSN
jgi:hypothetical protein